ncbi:hypothetical protein BDV96DRAFT_592993 [Lophiotrema nucula]|uniref:Myb-like domain-containing protein n=1 Tax=Lophiotrema nucula TaxID=690887 RepID=A0A6A5ZT79_9PLEO|nr:hypothetical protein BDV96DRAFT_592993 [Lophiotrema nucula]
MAPKARPELGEILSPVNRPQSKTSKPRARRALKQKKPKVPSGRENAESKRKGDKTIRSKRKDNEEWQDEETKTLLARRTEREDFKDIGKLLNRTAKSCEKRYNEMRRVERERWTDEDDEKLLRLWFGLKGDKEIQEEAFRHKTLSQVRKRRIQ